MNETLAIIAYKQLISRQDIDLIIEINTHLSVVQQLVERGWINIRLSSMVVESIKTFHLPLINTQINIDTMDKFKGAILQEADIRHFTCEIIPNKT